MKRTSCYLVVGLIAGMSWLGVQEVGASSYIATNSDRSLTIKKVSPTKAQSQSSSCPANIENLTALLLRDLPSYANRASQSSRRLSRAYDSYSYILLAGKPEFTPLTLGPGEYKSAASTASSEAYQQVFITTLERSYTKSRVVELQQYHWLFLTPTANGWYLGLMFSQIGSYPNVKPPSPPRESSKGVIGQAINTWLRDCRAGSVRLLNPQQLNKS